MTLFLPKSRAILPALAALMALAGCSSPESRGPVVVDVVGKPAELAQPLRNARRPTGEALLAASAQGLVRLDAAGQIRSGMAERWIVEDNSRAFIFRLQHIHWRNGDPIKSNEVARLLKARLAANPDLTAGLKPTVRAITDQVIEIDLDAPLPNFLQLLAHPARPEGGTGPMRKTRKGSGVVLEHARSAAPEEQAEEDGADQSADGQLPVHLYAVSKVSRSFVTFRGGRTDLVLGLRFQHLPYLAVAGIAKPYIRIDPASGLFGLQIEGRSDFLKNRDTREILSMAIDRARITQLLAMPGWTASSSLLPGPLDTDQQPAGPDWDSNGLAQRQGYAGSVVRNWTASNGTIAPLTIALPAGPGARMLYLALARDYRRIGLTLRQVPWDSPADLRLIDETAPFDSALWYLNRTGCRIDPTCAQDMEKALDEARNAPTSADRAKALQAAYATLMAANSYIPLGQPIRFALVSTRLTGFHASPQAVHPIDALIRQPRNGVPN